MTTPPSVLRRSAAELLASAVIDLFPGVLLAGGGATEHGFYYDFIAEQPIDENALPLLEEKMRGCAKEGTEVRTLDMMRENAAAFMEHRGQPVQAERILDNRSNIVQMIQMGPFTDICEAPYVDTMAALAHIKLLRVETHPNPYPDENTFTLKRIVGIVAEDKQELKQQAKALRAGSKHDHRKSAKTSTFFDFFPDVSEHALVLGPQGTLFKDLLIDWWKKERRLQAYSVVATPVFVKTSSLDKTGMEVAERLLIGCEIEGTPYSVPSTPLLAHTKIFKSMCCSLNDLPIRLAEISPVVPLGKQPGLWGAFAAEITTGDFAHVFCTGEQLTAELISSLQFIAKFTKLFGFEYRWNFAGKGKAGAAKQGAWKTALGSFESAFAHCGLNVHSTDEDALMGPRATAVLVDRFGREWNGPVVGVDLSVGEWLGTVEASSGKRGTVPFLISSTVFGPVERFAALLLEHNEGTLPYWLMPEQVPAKAY